MQSIRDNFLKIMHISGKKILINLLEFLGSYSQYVQSYMMHLASGKSPTVLVIILHTNLIDSLVISSLALYLQIGRLRFFFFPNSYKNSRAHTCSWPLLKCIKCTVFFYASHSARFFFPSPYIDFYSKFFLVNIHLKLWSKKILLKGDSMH